MENFMNSPTNCQYSDEDIAKEFKKLQDKRKVAKIHGKTIKEVTAILKRNKK